MFSKEITNSSEFQMMSPSAQALYLHIGMNSDDDGFCEVFTIVRMTESKPDDLRALHERGFVYLVDSKVGIVKDWHTNNDIRSDRYTQSKYLNDPKYGETYKTIMQDKIQHLSRYKPLLSGSTSGITQVRLGKDRLNTGEVETSQEIIEVKEDQKEPKKPARYKNARTVFSWFPNPQKSWNMNTTELEYGLLLFERGEEKVKQALQYVKNHSQEEFFPQVNKPSDLEKKWLDIATYAKRNS